ncbi:MAG: chromophore lyase CpcT/CpeT [Cyanobacteriota bacterium]|nr:chromophore lyase CpcT/CpeT [Cyanobacteriota bacterium]
MVNNLSQNQVDLLRVTKWLVGTYSNRQQALDQAVWFIPVTLWYAEVPHLFAEGIGFFTEQVNQHKPQDYYRSRVLQLLGDPLRLENYKLRDQSMWAGASQDPQKLSQLKASDCEWLEGCTINLTYVPQAISAELADPSDSYFGNMQPGGACCLSPQDRGYIEIEFQLTADHFITLDRGFDKVTGQQTWGSKAGAYHYRKQR